jgi:hypothetical protein
MKVTNVLLIILLFILVTSCSAEIKGSVMDAETGKPVEGAIVLVEWTRTKGLGLTYTKSAKVIEAISDGNGIFRVSKSLNPLNDPPDITIYKKGYIAWNNKFIFPDYAKRTNFTWQDGYVFKIDKFKDSYSYIKHQSFIDGAIHVGLSTEKKQLFLEAYNDGEGQYVARERRHKDMIRNKK